MQIRRRTKSLQESRPEIKLGISSWHYRVYQWWLRSAGKREPSIENLCHYMRVVLIWAPWRWFVYTPIAFGVAPSAYLLGLIVTVAFVVVILVAPIAALIILGYIGFWVALFVVGTLFHDQFDRLSRWLIKPLFARVVSPLAILTVLGAIALVLIFGLVNLVLIVLLIALICLGIAAAFGLLFLLVYGGRYLLTRTQETVNNPTTTANLVWEFSKATKNRILCPLIHMPE